MSKILAILILFFKINTFPEICGTTFYTSFSISQVNILLNTAVYHYDFDSVVNCLQYVFMYFMFFFYVIMYISVY